MAHLPLLLAGPIIRRAEPSGIWIWLATSESVTEVKPRIIPYHSNGSPDPRYAPGGVLALAGLTPASFRCVRLGQNLWVTLFGMEPKNGTFPTDIILGYTFSIKTTSGWKNLDDLVDDLKRDLCYPPFPFPTLFLQSRDGKLAHASCRRPGAHGMDAFSDFDSLLSGVSSKLEQRPAAFFLTGDQIYADDVAYPLFISVEALSFDIMGYNEYLPDVPYMGKLISAAKIGYSLQKNEVGKRRSIVTKAGFTTDDGEGHLMTFGEFAAHYLLVWNPKLCTMYGVEKSVFKNLKDFAKRVAEARRVLANIPTYMSFDDHEITDDWNLSYEWVEGTKNPLARRVITNGLAAFWFFQGWGNVPQLLGPGTDAEMTYMIEKRLAAELRSCTALDESFEKDMLDREPYAYIAPTKPQVIVTDTRTHRYLGGVIGQNSSLLDTETYTHLSKICEGLPANKPVVILTGSPLLPWKPIMALRATMLYDLSTYDLLGDEVYVPERGSALESQDPQRAAELEYGDIWEDHPEGRAALFRWVHDVLKPSYCLFFSGDVHFGYVVKGKATLQVSEEDKHELWSLDVVQITSSPMKNEPNDLRKTLCGVPVQDIIKAASSVFHATKGISEAEVNSHWLRIAYDAVELEGPLARLPLEIESDPEEGISLAPLLLKPLISNSNVIFRNHICVVDFTKPKQIGTSFYGSGVSSTAFVSV